LLAGFDPRFVLLVAGAEEGGVLATVRAFAGAEGYGPRSLIVGGPGAHYDFDESNPDIDGSVADFLAERLLPGG
jgi:hypothetical protein